MKNHLRTITLATALAAASLSQAQSYWYNGDFDQRAYLWNSAESNGSSFSMVFENFRSGASVFRLTGAFGCYLISGLLPTRAYVELRKNVRPGYAGDRVQVAVLPLVIAATGRMGVGRLSTLHEYKGSVDLRNSYFYLSPNTEYWICVTPIVATGSAAWSTSTDGGDYGPMWDGMPSPVGLIPGRSIVHSPSRGWNWASVDALYGRPMDFSYGCG